MRRTIRHHVTFVVGALVLVFGLPVVGGQPPAFGAERLKLIIPHRVLFTVALPHYVAEERGFYGAAGIEITPVFTRGGGESIQVLLAGNAEVGVGTGFFSVIGPVGKGAPIAVISAEYTGADQFWFSRSDSPVKSVRDLAGRKLGYSRPGASTHMIVLAVADELKAAGLQPPALLSVGGPPDAFTAVMTGQVDAGWSTPPFFLQEVEEGKIRIVLRGDEVKAVVGITARVNYAHRKVLAERPEAVRAFQRARKQAFDWMYARRSEAAEIWIKRADLKMPKAIVLKTWDMVPREAVRMFAPKGVEQTLADALKLKFIREPLTAEQKRQMLAVEFAPE
ncbi:MAG: ABC transporter substrate-binding protein [Deltaproteobacteria bacterium]|nr:ABC transporter substrate-binding protein [Deltaproteobacteria bacterium]